MLATLALTVHFGSSDALAGAYGTAVSTTMLLTTVLLYRVMRVTWRWSASTSLVVFSSFIGFDLAFFSANFLKITEGGWVPLSFAMLILIVMVTWRDGIDALHRTQDLDAVTISHFVRQLRERKIKRVSGKAIFLTRLQGTIPPLIANHLRQMGALYQNIVALTVRFAERPRIERDRRITIKHLGPGFWHFTVTFGFIEVPNVPNALHSSKLNVLSIWTTQSILVGWIMSPVVRRGLVWPLGDASYFHFCIVTQFTKVSASACLPKISCRSDVREKFNCRRRSPRCSRAAMPCPLWVKSGHVQCTSACPLCTKSGHWLAPLECPLSAKAFDHPRSRPAH